MTHVPSSAVEIAVQMLLDGSGDSELDDDLPSFADLFDCPTETVCEFGNVTLVVNDGFHPQQKIKVSSCVLASSSKVFRAMFNKRYSEGQALDNSHSEVAIEDPPRPFLAMCQMLHLKATIGIWGSEDALDLALLIDKYDCVEALRPATWALLTRLVPQHWQPWNEYIVAACYLLGHADLFRHCTKEMVFHGLSMKITDSRCVQVLPSNISYILEAQRAFLLHLYTRSVTSMLNDFTSAAFPAEKPNLTRVMMADMQKRGIWPIDLDRSSIEQLLYGLSSLQIPVLEAAPDQPYVRPALAHRCNSMHDSPGGFTSRLDHAWGGDYAGPPRSTTPRPVAAVEVEAPTHSTIAKTIESLKACCVGICLDCVKVQDHCRTSHPTPWTSWQWPKEWERTQTFDGDDAWPSGYAAPAAWGDCW